MNGSPAKLGSISGTSGHSSALKMKQEQDSALKMTAEQNGEAKVGSSPNKAVPLIPILWNAGRVAVTRAAPHIIKQAPKIINKSKKKIVDVVGTTVKNPTVKSTIKKAWKRTPGWVKATGAYFGIDAAIDKVTGSGNNKKTTTPPATTKPKTPKSSSGDAWSKAVNKNKSTGGGVTLSEYVKIRNSNAKGSAKYNAAQNKINEAYGSSKRYGPGTPSSSSTSNSTTKTKKRLGGGTTKVTKSDGQKTKVKYDRKGDVKKTITKGKGRRTVTDSEGNIIRSRKTRNKKWD